MLEESKATKNYALMNHYKSKTKMLTGTNDYNRLKYKPGTSQIQNDTNLRCVPKNFTNFKMQICLSSESVHTNKSIFCICDNIKFCLVFIQF